jgi:hypothetical protein
VWLCLVVLVGILAASGFGANLTSGAVAAGRSWHVVVLGDSGASGSGDPTRLAWGGRYGQLLRRQLGVKVVVTNLAREGKSSSDQLAEVRSDSTTRAALKNADDILFGSTSGAALNAADERLQAKQCKGETCYAAALRGWSRDYERIVVAAAALRGTKKTVLRGVTEPNVVPGARDVVPPFATVKLGLYQAKLIKQAVCATMKAHRGRCVDVLAAFNGASGTDDAYKSGLMNKIECCYPSGKGQQLIAQLLLKTGLAPLR